MAVSINGKTYTDHPLMDEICYNCKKILQNIVIKNDILAGQKETDNSIENAEMLKLYTESGYISFSVYPFTEEIISKYSIAYDKNYTTNQIKSFVANRYNIPTEDRASLTDYANQYFLDNYFYDDGRFIEENDYYRTFMGLPPFNTGTEYYIEIDKEADIPQDYWDQLIPNADDGKYYIHEQNSTIAAVLYADGIIDAKRSLTQYKGSNFAYASYLGDRSIDLLTARNAAKWDILYIPSVYYLIKDRFTELYKINRETYSRRYQTFFAESGDYYDQMMIVIVLCETFADLITDTPEWYIRRDIFDIRSCQYFLDSYGVTFFKSIPLKYQIRIVKNLNRLIKYKSTYQNFEDILSIFVDKGFDIYKYWLYKNTSDPENPKLEFVSSPIGESYSDYIRDASNRTPYDDITLQDKYWDGELLHDDVKNAILAKKFTVEGSKYMSAEYHISMTSYLMQIEYFLGMILNSNCDLSDFKIAVSSISDTSTFNVADMFLYLIVLTDTFDRTDMDDDTTKIRYITPYSGSEPTINEEYYDWKKKYMPEIYVPKYGRVYGFNSGSNLDLDGLIDTVKKRHSHFRFGAGDTQDSVPYNDEEYSEVAEQWVEELGLRNYIDPKGSYSNMQELYQVYSNNTKIFDTVKDAIVNAENQDDQKLLEYVFQELFTTPFDTNGFAYNGTQYYDLVDLLKARNYLLYNNYKTLIAESNLETRQDNIRAVMNDIIDTLDYYLQSYDGLNYLFAFTSTQGFTALINYIYLMVNFFKSYKVYFLDPYITYESDDKLTNSVRPIDNIEEWKFTNYTHDRAFAIDIIGNINMDIFKEDDAYSSNHKEITNFFSHYIPDQLSDMNYNGNTPTIESEYDDLDGGSITALNAPNTTINGGIEFYSTVEMDNLNGGEPDIYNRAYMIIDAGVPFNPDDERTDWRGRQQFNYLLDGGCPDGRNWYTNLLHLYLKGTELIADVIVSPRTEEYIETFEDGLYISSDNFPSMQLFKNVINSLQQTINMVKIEGQKATTTIDTILDINLLTNKIITSVNGVLYNFDYVNKAMEDDRFVVEHKAAIDELISIYKADVQDILSPYTWADLN